MGPGHTSTRKLWPPPTWALVVCAAALCGWLVWGELQASGLFDRARDDGARAEPDARALPFAPLEDELRERARLRGLPGIQTATDGVGRLVGKVMLNVRGAGPKPLRDVRVRILGLEDDRLVPKDAITDEDGAFHRDDLTPQGAYTLVVHEDPYREVILRGLSVQRDRTTDVGTILLGAPTALDGEVVDAAGRPVGGARVKVFADASRPGRLDIQQGLKDLQGAGDALVEVVTDADGGFEAQDLPPGPYVLRVEARGHAVAFRDDVWVTVDELSSSVRVVLDPGGGFYGRVVDDAGRGIGGARVLAVPAPGREVERLDRVDVFADPEGRYRLDSLLPGTRYFIEAWAEGYAPMGRIVVARGLDALDLELSATGRITGRITDARTRDAIGGAEVTVTSGGMNALSPVSAVTESDGTYVLPYVSPGPIWFFAVRALGYPPDSFDATKAEGRKIVAGETLVLDWTLSRGAVVAGRITDQRGDPVPYATVAFSDARRRLEGELTGLADAEGRYRVEGLREATYDVAILATGYAPPLDDATARVEVPSGVLELERDFVLERGGIVRGTVRDPDGAPVAGARIVALAEDRTSRRLRESLRDLVAVSNAVGAYRLTGVPPAISLYLEATHDAWVRGATPRFQLEAGEEKNVDITLGAGASITGRVVNRRGAGVAEARVRWGHVAPEDERRLRDSFRADELLGSRVIRTDEDGTFTLARVEPGRLLLKVEKEGYSEWYRHDYQVPADGSAPPTLRVELEDAGRLRGRVLDARTGAPVREAWVYAEARRPGEDEPSDAGAVRPLLTAQTDDEGRFVIERVPAARYDVTVWLAVGYRAYVQDRDEPSIRREDVEPGGPELEFRLQRESAPEGD